MVISCAAFGCTNRQLKGSFIQFHRFPLKRTDVLQKWIKEVRRKNFIPTKYSFLCSEHFIESDYQIRPGATTKLLYDNAVPSVFKTFPVHLQKSLSVKRRLLQRNNTDFNTTILPSSKQTETTSENIETGEETSSLSVQKINNKDKSIQCVIKSPTEERLRCKIQILQKRLKRQDLKIKNFKSLLASIKKNVPASDEIISILEDNFDYGNNMSITQHSNIMSDNDNIVPSCSTSNPIPSCSNTNLISSNSKIIQNANCNTVNLNESCNNPGPSNEDEELTLPRASVNKMIKDALPNIRVANDVREMIMNCCSEFIHLVSSEANQVCMAQHKKTINAEHLLTALDQLGFGDYRAQAEEVVKDCKSKRRRQSTRLENLGIPEEELLRQQQELFAKAREEQMAQEQQQWQELQAAAQQAAIKSKTEESSDEDDYS